MPRTSPSPSSTATLKAGGDGSCTDDNLYTPAQAYFASLERPLFWVPGDNDWTDCWGRYGPGTFAPGADDPEERLQHERDLFASTPFTLGQKKLRLTRQSSEGRRLRALLGKYSRALKKNPRAINDDSLLKYQLADEAGIR